MTKVNIFVTMILLFAHFGSSWSKSGGSYVEDACSVTRYRDLCIHSLQPYSNIAKRDPTKWARAGVSVAIGEAKVVSHHLAALKTRGSVRGKRNKIALLDCLETLQDTLDNLHRSLGVLRKLNRQTFASQMGDVTTWVSAALTDEDTCLDGFLDMIKEKQVNMVVSEVTNATHITSNALALANKLASTGLTDP